MPHSHPSPSSPFSPKSQEKRLSTSTSVNAGIDAYSDLHRKQTADARNANYQSLVNAYYDLATVFYEWGWGSSFHFSYQHHGGESFDESIRRHEYLLASQLQVSFTGRIGDHNNNNNNNNDTSTPPRPHILDVGCGIGGPLRHVATFLQCRVTGITLNPYQVQRGNELTARDPHATRLGCRSIQGDFMQTLPFEAGSLDGAYAIEATCHAPDRVVCYQQIYRVLRPGAVFACYEWCLTDQFDANNPDHLRMKKDIEEGNGLPDICDTATCWRALQEAGFEGLTQADLALVPDTQPWYTPLMPSWNPLSQRFQFNWLGAVLTNLSIWLLEKLRIAPAGTVKTQKVLQAGGFALRDAGQEGIFTAMYLMVGRKPLE